VRASREAARGATLIQTWRVRELLFCLVRRDLIVRYQSSVLGFFWSFVKPLALVAIFWVAFRFILRIDTDNPNVPFALHLLVGILVWSFLAGCVTQGYGAILFHANLVKKVKLPVEVFPAAAVIGNLVNFLLGMVVVFPIILIYTSRQGGGATWTEAGIQVVLFLLVTLLLTVLAQALTLFVSAVNVYYRDVESLAEVGLQAWFYATPIIYPGSMLYRSRAFESVADRLGERTAGLLENLYWLNPMAPICVAYRRILLYREAPAPPGGKPHLFNGLEIPDGSLFLRLAVSAGVILLLYFLAQFVFGRCARFFADEV